MLVHPHGAGERAIVMFERVCVYLIGPLTPVSSVGASYALSMTDACTDLSFAFPLKTKAEAGVALRDWILYLENHANKKVKIIRTDGEKTMPSNDVMRQFMASKGIKVEFSSPYSPKLTGKAERHNRFLMERTCAMLLGSRLPLAHWGEMLVAVSFIMN